MARRANERRAAKPLFNDPGDPYFGKIWIVRTANGTRRIKIDFDKPQKENILIEKNSFLHYYPLTKQGESKSLSDAGRKLFTVSRQSKSRPNDTDRLRKYLAKLNLSWNDLAS